MASRAGEWKLPNYWRSCTDKNDAGLKEQTPMKPGYSGFFLVQNRATVVSQKK